MNRYTTRNSNSALAFVSEIAASPPSLQDNTADLDRLKKAVRAGLPGKPVLIPFTLISSLANGFRTAGFRGAAIVNNLPHGYEVVDFLGHPPRILAGMALDLGTTHLEGSILNLTDGTLLARGSILNSQIEHGHDILARIHFALLEDNLGLLHEKVVASINELASRLCREARISTHDIRALVVAGNTTMMHFLAKLNPYHICREPYTPVANTFDPSRASDLGITINPRSSVWMLPNVGSYFGGDLIAGIIASGLDQAERPSMLIDVGTNAEVVMGNRDWLLACAGAAGPALEGGVARMGIRAQPGAIERAAVNPLSGKISYSTIDNKPARGICGSGMIDLVAGLYLSRAINARGKFRKGASFPMIITSDGPALVVASREQTAEGEPIVLTQLDLDAIMRSKAAMYAILTTIAGQVGVSFEELDTIFVAGAFGRHIDPRSAITLGMIPDLPLATYVPLGNSSLAGAEILLLDEAARRRSQELAARITYIELNVNQEFMLRFSGSGFIPHTDHVLFPSVPVFLDD